MSVFTREVATRLAEQLQTHGYKLFLVVGMKQDDEDIEITLVGSGEPHDIDDLEDVLKQLCDELRGNIAFQNPVGSA